MSWGAVVSVGASLIGGLVSSNAGDDAADAQERANALAMEEQRRQFDLSRSDLEPWRQAGGWALGEQQDYLRGDMSGFINSAGYQAANRNGLAMLEAGATANGNLFGGGADADRIQFGQDNAWRYGSEYFNQLGGVAGTGQQAVNQLGALGANMANNISGLYNQNGMAQASAYMNSANAWGNALNTGVGAWNQWQGNRGRSSNIKGGG